MITEAKLNANYMAYIKRLEKYNCYSESMINDIGDLIKKCSYSMKEDSGSAYEGSMIDVVLNTLCKIAYDINEHAFGASDKNNSIAHPLLKVNFDMLMRVLLLQHIGKAVMYIDEEDQWVRKNKKMFYKFNDDLKSNLKLGERSLFLCQKYGIKLCEEEYEAIRIIDKVDDGKTEIYNSPLAVMTKFVYVLSAIELRKKFEKQNKKEKIEK